MLCCRRADKFPGNEHATKTPHAHAVLRIAIFSLSLSCAPLKPPLASCSIIVLLLCVFSDCIICSSQPDHSTFRLPDVQRLVDTLVTDGILDLVLSKIAPRAPPPSSGDDNNDRSRAARSAESTVRRPSLLEGVSLKTRNRSILFLKKICLLMVVLPVTS